MTSLFAAAYLGWKPPDKKLVANKPRPSNVPAYQDVMKEVERRMDVMNQQRQLPAPGSTTAEVMAEFERRTKTDG